MRKIVVISKKEDGRFQKELEVFANLGNGRWYMVRDDRVLEVNENPFFPDVEEEDIRDFLRSKFGPGWYRVFIAAHNRPQSQTLFVGEA